MNEPSSTNCIVIASQKQKDNKDFTPESFSIISMDV